MIVTYNLLALQYPGSRGYGENPRRLEDVERIGFQLQSDVNGEVFLRLVHSSNHIDKIKQICREKRRIAYIQTNDSTFQAACEAVATSVIAAQKGYFAAIRPPGHHASRESSSGFCIFNNIAIATQYLLNNGKRVCILDIDAHQGNGTEAVFRESDKVLFCSTHREFSWPFRDSSNVHIEEVERLYETIRGKALLDDRKNALFGEKATFSDYIGIPWKIIYGNGSYTLKSRDESVIKVFNSTEELAGYLERDPK